MVMYVVKKLKMNCLGLFFLFGGFILISSHLYEKPFYDVENAHVHFEEFIKKFDKQYLNTREKDYRLSVFKKNLHEINVNNEKNPHAVFDINKFSDLEHEEFKQMYLGLNVNAFEDICKNATEVDIPSVQAPESLDWRDKNAVTPVKDQGQCGSCWAFSVTGNIEGVNAIKTGKLVSVSEQQLLDCDKKDKACHGGYMNVGLSYVVQSGGIMSENDYPYKAFQQKCKFAKDKAVVKLSGCKQYSLSNEDKVKDVLASNGPLAIGIDGNSFQSYKSGILEICEDSDLNHGVLLVGYGVENDIPFWIIKNSWAETWGEKGYIRIKRGENTCGFLNDFMVTAVI